MKKYINFILVLVLFSVSDVYASSFTCQGLKTIDYLQKIFDLIKIIGPILVVLFGAFDYLKSIFSSNDDTLSKTNQRLMKRLIASFLIFILPSLLSIVLNFAGDRYGADMCGIK